MVRGEDLALLNENKGWYREGAHGREVEVSDIVVEKVPPAEEEKKGEAKYRMTAIINGEAITHEIKQKDYDKFLAVDDYHRMKLFSKVFSEVDMKTRPETNAGLGTKILAALTAGAVVTAEVAHDISTIITIQPRSSMQSIMAVHVLTSNREWIRHRRLLQGTLRQKPIMLPRR